MGSQGCGESRGGEPSRKNQGTEGKNQKKDSQKQDPKKHKPTKIDVAILKKTKKIILLTFCKGDWDSQGRPAGKWGGHKSGETGGECAPRNRQTLIVQRKGKKEGDGGKKKVEKRLKPICKKMVTSRLKRVIGRQERSKKKELGSGGALEKKQRGQLMNGKKKKKGA